jgi:hypothetical protein
LKSAPAVGTERCCGCFPHGVVAVACVATWLAQRCWLSSLTSAIDLRGCIVRRWRACGLLLAASPHGQTPSGLSGTRTRERLPNTHPQIRIRVAPKPRRAPASALHRR